MVLRTDDNLVNLVRITRQTAGSIPRLDTAVADATLEAELTVAAQPWPPSS